MNHAHHIHGLDVTLRLAVAPLRRHGRLAPNVAAALRALADQIEADEGEAIHIARGNLRLRFGVEQPSEAELDEYERAVPNRPGFDLLVNDGPSRIRFARYVLTARHPARIRPAVAP